MCFPKVDALVTAVTKHMTIPMEDAVELWDQTNQKEGFLKTCLFFLLSFASLGLWQLSNKCFAVLASTLARRPHLGSFGIHYCLYGGLLL